MNKLLPHQRTALAIASTVLFALYLWLNILTPLAADDCWYAADGRTLQGIAERQGRDYFVWSGRVVAHSIAMLLGGMVGKGVFNALNALAMCLLIWLTAKVGKVRSLLGMLAIVVAVWFLMPDQYVTQFMICGSLNYTWASCLVLAFLLVFAHKGEEGRGSAVWVVLLSALAGVWSEMYAVCVLPALLITLFLRRKSRPRLAARQWLMLACYAVGAAIVVLAPGNFARASEYEATQIGTRVINLLVFVARGPLPWMWVISLAAWLFTRRQLRQYEWPTSFFVLAIGFSLLLCAATGAAWPRTHFPVYLFSAMLLARSLQRMPTMRVLSVVVLVGVVAWVGADFAHEVRVLAQQRRAVAAVAEQAKVQSQTEWRGVASSRKSLGEHIFSSQSDDWRNLAFASYHGLKPFSVVPHEVSVAVQNKILSSNNYILLPSEADAMGVKLTYSDSVLYHLPSKMSRVIDIFGTHLHEQYYGSAADAPHWMRPWLKPVNGLQADLDVRGDDCGIVRDADGKKFLYYRRSCHSMAGRDAIRIEPLLSYTE